MEYTVGDNVIVYDIYSSPSECKEDIDLIFSVGKATKVVYVKDVQLNSGKISDLIAALKEFCRSLKNQCILFSLDTAASCNSNVLTRYVLQEADFWSLKKYIDDKDCTLFMYNSPVAYPILIRLFDEYISFEICDMLANNASESDEDKYDRLDLLLARIGTNRAKELQERIKKFLNGDLEVTSQPKKLEI